MSKKTSKDVVVQSFWTKPLPADRLCDTLFIAALSLAYAHRSGYAIHMHTDSYGASLLQGFGYDKLHATLDGIPPSVPHQLFAAGKFYAMQAEGVTDKVHIDYDVFLKKPGVLDKFYRDKKADVIVQCEEGYEQAGYLKIVVPHVKAIGYTEDTDPDWKGSWNTGVIGFHNKELAEMYMGNYFRSLDIYTEERFAQYLKEHPDAQRCLTFDFFLEQCNISKMAQGYNVCFLLPKDEPTKEADRIGYQHLQGGGKWSRTSRTIIRHLLYVLDKRLYEEAEKVALTTQHTKRNTINRTKTNNDYEEIY